MHDLIDRQAAIDVVKRLMGDYELSRTVQTGLHILPSAQPERKKGKWIFVTNGRGGHECDQCHEYAPSWATGEERLTNFCPNCGAKMEAKE